MKGPPQWSTRFLNWFCDPELVEDLEGDLLELFVTYESRWGTFRARWLYSWLVFRSLRLSAIRKNDFFKNSINPMVLKNFKIALRVLWKDKFNTAMNLLGLTIGIFCFLLLGSYVKHELSFDRFHDKKDRLYRSWLREDYGEGKVFFNSTSPLRFESLFEDNFPEVEAAVQYDRVNCLVGEGEDRINEQVAKVSPDFFDVFDFPLIYGDPSTVLHDKHQLLLSESYVEKYFGNTDPLGQTLTMQVAGESRKFNVSGVFQEVPATSSMQFDILISNANDRDIYGDGALTAWFLVAPETYVLLKEGAAITSMEEKMQDVVLSQMGDASYGEDAMQRDQYNIGFQKLTDIHLDPSIPLGFAPVSNPQYVFILATIGLLVLFIACINYTTISTGQSLRRSKEVGLRKVLGARRRQLVTQYLSESVILSIVAMTVASLVTYLLIPVFNRLIGIELTPSLDWYDLLIALLVGVVAGLYPALVTAKFKTIDILRATGQSSGKLWVRKALMVAQFLITVFLISTSLIMRDQLNFLTSKDLGFNYEAKIATRLQAAPDANRLSQLVATGMENGKILKSRLEQYPEISEIGMGSHMFGTSGWANVAYTDHKDVFRRFRFLVVDAYYLPAFGIEMVEGRAFEPGNGLDERQSVILNGKAVELFGLEDPIGKKLPGNEFGDHQIIGVTENFHFTSLHSEIEPLVIVQNIMPIAVGLSDGDFGDTVVPKLVFTYTGSNLQRATEILQQEWEAVFPDERWNYQFLDQQIQNQYENEVRMGRLITVATVISIVIAALGLLGLSMLVANSKEKEIGIRKVMGASPISIFGLMARGFSIQVVIAIVLSIPVTYWLMEQWLQNFAYRTNIGVELFVYSGLMTIVISIIVISYHTLKAAMVNPIQSLRTE